MKILVLANNWVGWQVIKWLKEQRQDVVGVVVHPLVQSKYRKQILEAVKVGKSQIFNGVDLRKPAVRKAVAALKPDIGVSVLFNYILDKEFLGLFQKGCINVHPAYLPYNRGQYPNVWSIVESTPAGVTIHYIDPGIDSGDIIAQTKVVTEPVDTGYTLYQKLEKEAVALFKKTWPKIKSGKVRRIAQQGKKKTYHRTKDVETIDQIDLNRKYKAKDLINIIRARTFPPYAGAYFVEKGKKVNMRLELSYGDKNE